jgi:hypothetical protein
MAGTLKVGGVTLATHSDATGLVSMDSSVTFPFPAGAVINYQVSSFRGEYTNVGEGFFNSFDTTITAKSNNSCFKYTMSSQYGVNYEYHSASYRLYVQVNSGSDNLIKDINNNDNIASFGSYPDTGKLPYHRDGNHAKPFSFSHFDYTTHSAGDSMKYKFWIRTQGGDILVFNRAQNGTDQDYRASGITTIIIEEFEK